MCDSPCKHIAHLWQTLQEADSLHPRKTSFPSAVLSLASSRLSLIGDVESLLILFLILKVLIARY